MAALAPGGRITESIVVEEIGRLKSAWQAMDGGAAADDGLAGLMTGEVLQTIDPFDRVQLAEVVRVCRSSRSLSDAGRKLFSVSRTKKASPNDADRLRKYLARFGLEWDRLK
jgi:transcriptional regulatory protein RtcR